MQISVLYVEMCQNDYLQRAKYALFTSQAFQFTSQNIRFIYIVFQLFLDIIMLIYVFSNSMTTILEEESLPSTSNAESSYFKHTPLCVKQVNHSDLSPQQLIGPRQNWLVPSLTCVLTTATPRHCNSTRIKLWWSKPIWINNFCYVGQFKYNPPNLDTMSIINGEISVSLM